jgi:hypothetical protein
MCVHTDVGHIVDDAEDGEDKIEESTFRAVRAYGSGATLHVDFLKF